MKRSKVFFGIFVLVLLLLPITAVYADDAPPVDGEAVQEETTSEETEHVHEIVSVSGLAPTCTEPGYKDHFFCEGCGLFFSDENGTEIPDIETWKAAGGEGYIAPTGHFYKSMVTTEPECTKEGVRTFTCEICQDSYTESIPATGHHFSSNVCSVCGIKEDVVYRNGGWYYVIGNDIQYSYTGIKHNSNGWWRIVNGKVDFTCESVEQNEYGWWYIKGGKVQFGYTGIKPNSNGWWRIVNGKVDFDCNSVEHNENGWWYCSGGKVQFGYNGAASNSYGTWLITNGKVTFSENGVVNGRDGNWYYASGGKVQTGYTGIKDNRNGWWRIVNGVVDFSCESVEQNEYGWWYISGGKVQFGYTGIKPNKNGWWRIVNGKVDFNCNSVEENENGWWYIRKGKVDFSFDGLAKNKNGWWFIRSGKVDFSYTGVASDDTGSWYINNGKLDSGYTGTVSSNGIIYNVSGGLVTSPAEKFYFGTVFSPLARDGNIHFGTAENKYEIECVHACYCDVHSWTNPSTGHLGVDLICNKAGQELLAVASGTVVYVNHQSYENNGSYGSHPGEAVAVYIGNGLIYEYHELQSNSVKVKVGDYVNAGDVIGKVGLTGVTTGLHIHFSVLYWVGAEYEEDLSEMPSYYGPSTSGFIQINPLFFFGESLARQTESWYPAHKYEWYGYKSAIPGDPRNYPVLASRIMGY
ncbi:MAG: M23 family metallopeptidase [Lachnospiraceae bacterium]|nr:M23 family metallopeptidase [Lachnospiraceae bacterium]